MRIFSNLLNNVGENIKNPLCLVVFISTTLGSHAICEVRWSVGDFVVMGLLLLGLGLSIELVLKKIKSTSKLVLFRGSSPHFCFDLGRTCSEHFNSPWAGS